MSNPANSYTRELSRENTEPLVKDIMAIITTTWGSQLGIPRLRSQFPAQVDRLYSETGRRAYYIWRMARWYGGKDMSNPFTAGLVIRNDPLRHFLDSFAQELAQASFGKSDAPIAAQESERLVRAYTGEERKESGTTLNAVKPSKVGT